jgi:hypothetical protein
VEVEGVRQVDIKGAAFRLDAKGMLNAALQFFNAAESLYADGHDVDIEHTIGAAALSFF